jgi:hypothetical protein
MNLRSFLGEHKRWLHRTSSWLLHEFPKAPRLELYSRRIDRDNRQLTQTLREGGDTAFCDYVSPCIGKDIPRTLWIFWARGEASAPPVVQKCIASWRRENPEWDIRVLDGDAARALVDLSDCPRNLPIRFEANLLRLRLLAQHGGIWTDATTYCHRPLDDWVPMLCDATGFFVFSSPHVDRWFDNWFIAAHPENPLIGAWHEAYRAYVTRLMYKPDKYFMMIYSLQWRLLRDPSLMVHFRRCGSLPALPCFLLQGALHDRIGPEAALHAIARGLPLSKLSWKVPGPEGRLEELLARASQRRGHQQPHQVAG